MIRKGLWLAILIATPSSVLAQQGIQSLRPGQQVRINGGTKVSYVAVSGDSLIAENSSFPLSSIRRLEVSAGQQRQTRKGSQHTQQSGATHMRPVRER